MKLAEALILRADTQQKIEQLRDRIQRSVHVQEGDEPMENPRALLQTLDAAYDTLTRLIQQINRTNAQTSFGTTGKTLTDALAERDTLLARRNMLQRILDSAANLQNRYSHSEIKFVVTIDAAAIQKQVDQLSRDFRQLDTEIQQANWTIDLVE